jgi:hypothetical protein
MILYPIKEVNVFQFVLLQMKLWLSTRRKECKRELKEEVYVF